MRQINPNTIRPLFPEQQPKRNLGALMQAIQNPQSFFERQPQLNLEALMEAIPRPQSFQEGILDEIIGRGCNRFKAIVTMPPAHPGYNPLSRSR